MFFEYIIYTVKQFFLYRFYIIYEMCSVVIQLNDIELFERKVDWKRDLCIPSEIMYLYMVY